MPTKIKSPEIERYIVAVDPGSKEMGVALLQMDGTVDAAFTLLSDKPTWGQRLDEITRQLPFFIGKHDRDRCTDFVTEIVQNGPLANISALLIPHFLNARFTPEHRLVPSEWKAFARRNGATTVPQKGVPTLREMGVKYPAGIDDNAADAILLGLTFIEQLRKKG